MPVFAVVALFAGCGQEGSEPESPAPAEPVVVFASGADRAYLAGLFAGYTRATGVRVIVRTGKTGQLVADVIENRIDPPADLLWTDDVTPLHHAAEEGALRPIRSEFVATTVPPKLRDPDGFWTGVSYRLAVIALAPGVDDAAETAAYGSLAADRFTGRVCLGSATSALNRAVIGVLVDELGSRRAEVAVRMWIRNLAREIYADDARLVAAIAAGDCPAGIVPSDVLLAAQRDGVGGALTTVLPAAAAVHAEGIGIGRHARNPDGALALLEWLLGDAVLTAHAAGRRAYPATLGTDLPAGLERYSGTGYLSLSALAFGSEDAVLLAERAGYRD